MMDIKVSSFQQFGSLSIIQFSTNRSSLSVPVMSGSAAMKDGILTIKEISDSGSVNNLTVINSSENYIFLMDGDVLIGAKQNRVVNTSILIAPLSKSVIPVSCVEQGRWRHTSNEFKSADFLVPQFIRASKAKQVFESLSEEKGYKSDQGEVWDIVSWYNKNFDTKSKTDSLSDTFDNNKMSIDDVCKNFSADEEANGVVVFINNKINSIDEFGSKELYSNYFSKIVRSAALDTIHLKENEKKLEKPEAVYKSLEFLDSIEMIEKMAKPGVCLGTERRFNNDKFSGFELRFSQDLIHLTGLNLELN